MGKKLVLVDMDDVLINLNETAVVSLNEKGYSELSLDNIVTFSLNKDIDVSMLPQEKQKIPYNGLGCPREALLQEYSDYKLFEVSSFYEGVYDAMRRLCEKFNVCIHTHCFNNAIAVVKIEKLDSMFSGLDLIVNLCIGRQKLSFSEPYAVFEDCAENLVKYDSSCRKFLLDKPWNCELFNSELLSGIDNMTRVKNFVEGVNLFLSEVE